MAWFPASGTGGGGGFTLGPVQNVFTGADRAAAESARDTYFTANPTNLAQYNADTSLNIRLEYADSGDQIALYQVRNNAGDAWLDNQSFRGVRGAPGADGQEGTALEFSSISARDSFFANRPDVLVNGLPVVVNLGDNMVASNVWNGPDNPTDYTANDERWRTASNMVSNNSLFIGSTRFSNSVQGISISDALNNNFLAIGSAYDNTGTLGTAIFDLSSEDTLVVNEENTTTISAPITVQYTTFGDNFTTDFDFIPAEAGELRAEFFIGTDSTGTLIFDETRTVTQAEVDANQFVSFGVGNPYILDQGVGLFARFTGVDLRGGTVDNPDSQFDGQELIAFRSTIQPFTRRAIAFEDQVVDTVSAEISGNDLTITVGRGTQSDLMTTVTLPSTGGTTPQTPVSASITRFEIQGQSTSVLAGTTLSGSQTFNYNVNHPEDVNGNLSLVQNGVVLRNDISPSGNSFTQAITSQTLQNNQQVVFELRGVTNENIAIQMFFRVRAHLPTEQLFYGQSTSNNPASVDINNLSHSEAGIDGTVISTGTTTAGNYFILLVPNDHDLVSIRDGLGQDVTSVFTRAPDVRNLNGVLYTSYVFGPVNAGASESYTVGY